MEKIIKYITYLWMPLFILCFSGCADEIVNQSENKGEGTLLNLYANFQGVANTRLAELPGDKIGTAAGAKNYKNVGLYIYYQDDYDKGDLSKPYIRNLEMTYDATNKKLVATGTSQEIYIYDRMKIVALYPYNKDATDFVDKKDEESYYFSESDYKDQLYIPYRAAENINPTNAFTAQLHFSPKQTCKVQIVLTANDPSSFPTYNDGDNKKPYDEASITILPNVDPVTIGDYANVDRREQWIDHHDALPKDAATTVIGGKYVRRYNAYLWTTKKDLPHHDDKAHWDNIINKGDILFRSDKLTLVVPAKVDLSEQQVYRYGYDLDNGEMFIPTSETLVYDATSLKDASLNSNRTYQVCDIDLSSISPSWTPKDIYSATYDGGGHAITGMKINATMTAAADDRKPGIQAFGLFGTLSNSLKGTSKIINTHLVAPEIIIDGAASKDNCYVGGLCGLLNPELSKEDIEKMIRDGLPKELSEPVREALVAEALRDLGSTTCTIEGCKVENPKITVNNATAVVAGGFCGGAGNQTQTGNITESYLSQTSDASFVKVNNTETDWQTAKTTPYVGSFCGLLHKGEIKNSYTTMANNVTASYSTGTTHQKKEAAVDFCYILEGQKVTDCRTTMTLSITAVGAGAAEDIKIAQVHRFDENPWVSWSTFVNTETKDPSNPPFNKWPCVSWTYYWVDLGSSPSTYPTLMWEYKPYLVNE